MSSIEPTRSRWAAPTREMRIRTRVAVAYTVGITVFFIWFIATHLTRYPG